MSSEVSYGERVEQVVQVIVGVLGIVLNSLALLVLGTKRRRKGAAILSRNARHLFLHQSFVDLIASSLIIVYEHYGFTVMPQIPGGSSAEIKRAVCKVFWSAYPFWAVLTVSTCNMLLLNFERYASIVHPDWRVNRSKAMARSGTSLSVSNLVITCVDTVLVFLAPVVFLVCCYWSIFRYIRSQLPTSALYYIFESVPMFPKSEVHVHQQADAHAVGQLREQEWVRRRSVLVTCVLIGLLFFLCFVWNAITWLQFNLGGPLDLEGVWYKTTIVLAFSNCCVNPLIYVFKLEGFRQQLIDIFLCREIETETEQELQDVAAGEVSKAPSAAERVASSGLTVPYKIRGTDSPKPEARADASPSTKL